MPITFQDNKKRFSFSFFSRGTGGIRATVHSFFETGLLAEEDKGTLREEVRAVILNELSKG